MTKLSREQIEDARKTWLDGMSQATMDALCDILSALELTQREALERAAKLCDGLNDDCDHCWTAENLATSIRALIKEPARAS